MQPNAAALQTFLATERARRDVADAGDVCAALWHSDHPLKRRFGPVAKKTMQRGHHLCTLADRAADAFDRSRAHVADGEHPRHRRFQPLHRTSLIQLVLRAAHHEPSPFDLYTDTVNPTLT